MKRVTRLARPSSERVLLTKYRAKRHFDVTPEPTGSKRIRPRAARRFVIQKHAASHLHYDFRLEVDGVLKSWAVPKGPSLDPRERRLAMQVEDHPLDYYDFEGNIPAGSYGGGEVIVWDWGTYDVVGDEGAGFAIDRGRLRIILHGDKLSGAFRLVKMKGRGGPKDNAWLLIKDDDESSDCAWKIDAHGESVKSGRQVEDLRGDDRAPKWTSRKKSAPSAKVKAAVAKRVRDKAPSRKPDPIPKVVHPELATLIDAPFDDDAWLFEIKWDGFRAIATIDTKGHVTMTSRNGKDLVAQFPTLASIADGFTEGPMVVDGEIVAFDAEGRSSFQRLQNGASAKISFVVFDVLYANGRDLRKEPLDARKETLAALVRPLSKNVIVSAHVIGEGKKLFDAARSRGLEGIVAKKRDAPYVEMRTRDWVKIKAQLEQECVVVGFTDPGGARAGFGSLILGLYDHGRLVYCGNVGTGFDGKTLATLWKKMKGLETQHCPFPKAPKTRTRGHWIEPKIIAQIRFTEWTHDGSMRHPAFLGLRDDKKPSDCHRERPRPASEVA